MSGNKMKIHYLYNGPKGLTSCGRLPRGVSRSTDPKEVTCLSCKKCREWQKDMIKIAEMVKIVDNVLQPSSKENKFIKLEELERSDEWFLGRHMYVKFKIAHQSHRGNEFGEDSDRFEAKNGTVLTSALRPGIHNDDFWVLGSKNECDNMSFLVGIGRFEKIVCAVKEYNSRFCSVEAKLREKIKDLESEIKRLEALVKDHEARLAKINDIITG